VAIFGGRVVGIGSSAAVFPPEILLGIFVGGQGFSSGDFA
jgi:hypothetical protein